MDELTDFEQQFEDRVRDFARAGVRPIDSAAVAHAVAASRPRGQGAGSSMRWLNLPLDRRAWTIAIAFALLVTALGGALLVGASLLSPPPLTVAPPATNGWIAFTVVESDPVIQGGDLDIWLVALDQDARRVVGDETDRVDQLCPAFSPDGRSLAYGRVEGYGEANYRGAALVVADVSNNWEVTDRLAIEVGDGLPPPCPLWSPDGERVAFGVNRTSPINPQQSADGSQVWVVTLADRGITVLEDLLATDLEWSPDGSLLAIASGVEQRVRGGALGDGLIRLYAPASGAMQTLEATSGVIELTWSPDGQSIAYTGVGSNGTDDHRELWVIDVETGGQRMQASRYGIVHGIGPVWSPDGSMIAFQRGIGGEHSEIVLLTPGDLADASVPPREAVLPVTARGSPDRVDPYRVAWSPDGQFLLMMAWGHPPGTSGSNVDPFLVAIPVDAAMPAVVLSRMDGLVTGDGYPDTTLVPIQTWGRAPSD